MESGGYWWLVGLGAVGLAGYWFGRQAGRRAERAALTQGVEGFRGVRWG